MYFGDGEMKQYSSLSLLAAMTALGVVGISLLGYIHH